MCGHHKDIKCQTDLRQHMALESWVRVCSVCCESRRTLTQSWWGGLVWAPGRAVWLAFSSWATPEAALEICRHSHPILVQGGDRTRSSHLGETPMLGRGSLSWETVVSVLTYMNDITLLSQSDFWDLATLLLRVEAVLVAEQASSADHIFAYAMKNQWPLNASCLGSKWSPWTQGHCTLLSTTAPHSWQCSYLISIRMQT